jgi:hypothetical protein
MTMGPLWARKSPSQAARAKIKIATFAPHRAAAVQRADRETSEICQGQQSRQSNDYSSKMDDLPHWPPARAPSRHRQDTRTRKTARAKGAAGGRRQWQQGQGSRTGNAATNNGQYIRDS